VKTVGEAIAAAKSENVLICAGECTATILPQFGGKIASIRIGERELLQAPLTPIAPRSRTMSFDEGDASGWDECLPSVAACLLETEAGPAEIPDHGDLWRVGWRKQESGTGDQGPEGIDENGASVTLIGRCFSLPLELERRVEIHEEKSGWRLVLNYKLRNTGRHPVPWSWAAHPLFAAEEGDRIVLPETIRALQLEGSGGNRLGTKGDMVSWPRARVSDGAVVDLRMVGNTDSRIGDKLFAGPLQGPENWCVLERTSAGVRIRVTLDQQATPYLGLWMCYGGWPERPGPKQMCLAMEPSTAPVDSLARTGPWSRALGPGESFSWPMKVEIERIERQRDA